MRLRFQKKRDKKEEAEDKLAGVDTDNSTVDDSNQVDEPLHVTKIRISHISPSTSSSSTASLSASASASISSSSLSHRSSQHGRKAGSSKLQTKKLPKVCCHRSKHERSTLHRSSQESTGTSKSASTIEEKRPPSPTSVRDFARAQNPEEEKTHTEDGKEADDARCNSDINNNLHNLFVCNNDSIRDMWIDLSSDTDTNTNTAANNESNGWDQFAAKVMSLRIEDLQDHYHANLLCLSDLGDYALSALEKNRCDMDDMFGKIEGIEFGTMAAEDDLNPMSWLRENHAQVHASMDAMYDQTLTACADATLCSSEEPPFECIGKEPRDVVLVVGLPSDDTDIDSSNAATTTARGEF